MFEAADSAFSAEISGAEGAELRRWLLGAEDTRSRTRGLKRRVLDLMVGDAQLETPLDALLHAARALPGPGWPSRLLDAGPELPAIAADGGSPFEAFLRAARAQILARLPGDSEPGGARAGGLECDIFPPNQDVEAAAQTLERALGRLAEPAATLLERLEDKLEAEADELDTGSRSRIEAAIRALRRRVVGSRADLARDAKRAGGTAAGTRRAARAYLLPAAGPARGCGPRRGVLPTPSGPDAAFRDHLGGAGARPAHHLGDSARCWPG